MFSAFFESVWWLLVLIGVMIIVHELGHYWAARFFDVKVEAFSFGFGPRLFGFRKGETDFRFSAILLGGYVKMAGEQAGEEGAMDPRSLLAKPRWQRMIIAFAGPAMNIILAVALLTGLFMVHFERLPLKKSPIVGFVVPGTVGAKMGIKEGDRVVQVDQMDEPTWHDLEIREFADTNGTMEMVLDRAGLKISVSLPLPADERTHFGFTGLLEQHDVLIANLAKGSSPARDAGLQSGDVLKSANSVPVYLPQSINKVVTESAGKPIEIVYLRGQAEYTTTVTPHWIRPEGGPTRAQDSAVPVPPAAERWMIGIEMREATEVIKMAFPEALRESVKQNVEFGGLIYGTIEGMVERRLSPKQMDGPIGMARMARSTAKLGVFAFCRFMAMVSLNLAIFNLLPIPILDGGVILMLLIEMIRRQDLSMQLKEAVFKVGFAFLMMVVVFVIYNDISKSRSESAQQVPQPAVQQQQPQHPSKLNPPPGETAKP